MKSQSNSKVIAGHWQRRQRRWRARPSSMAGTLFVPRL